MKNYKIAPISFYGKIVQEKNMQYRDEIKTKNYFISLITRGV